MCSRVFPDKTTMVERALAMAKEIASKSPIAVQTTKMQLNYARDHSVDEGLDYIVSFTAFSAYLEEYLKTNPQDQ